MSDALVVTADHELRYSVFPVQEDSVEVARVISDPDVMLGKPIVEGTRISVEMILEKLADGESVEQMLDSYPTLTREGVRAAIKYAVDVLRLDVVFPVGA